MLFAYRYHVAVFLLWALYGSLLMLTESRALPVGPKASRKVRGAKLQFKDCGRKNRAVRVKSLDIAPLPINLSDPLQIKLSVKMLRTIPGDLDFHVTAKRRNFFSSKWHFDDWISGVYSDNVCEFANDYAINSTLVCPLTPKLYRLNLKIPFEPYGASVLPLFKGNYKIYVRTHDPKTSEEYACAMLRFRVDG